MPSYDQVAALHPMIEQVVAPEHIDLNGHMNIRHYFELGGDALWQRSTRDLAMPSTYIADRGLTTFTAEQHLRYLDESREGDELGVPVVVVDRGDKSLHLAALVLNHTRRSLACVMEGVLVHVDYATRRPVSFPADVASVIDAVAASDRPDWPVPLSGGLGVRR